MLRDFRWWPGRSAAIALAIIAFVAGGIALLDRSGSPYTGPGPGQAFDVTAALSGEEQAAGYRRVTGPEPLAFPRDHGPHPGYRHEWWYVTGNVTTDSGRHFGFQATLFRFNIAPEMPARESHLATNQLWMAHMAVTDTRAGAFHHRERFVRGAAGLAGGSARPFRVHAEDWVMRSRGPGAMPMELHFPADDLAIELRLTPRKPLVLQGEQGYSRKGPEPGNASRYYSYTRLAADGRIVVAGEAHAVAGTAWMDREWGTSSLGADQAGWDWFALQLDDDRELMFYRLRRRDGSTSPRSEGLLVAADGTTRRLSADQVRLEPRRYWQSPRGGRYPVAWRMQVPEHDLDLVVEPVVEHQELDGVFRYWEGAVRVRGDAGPDGRGYAELTGYASQQTE